jgi:hypothetical protein
VHTFKVTWGMATMCIINSHSNPKRVQFPVCPKVKTAIGLFRDTGFMVLSLDITYAQLALYPGTKSIIKQR